MKKESQVKIFFIIPKREIQALLHASTELECRELLILTENYEAEEDVKWFGLEGSLRLANTPQKG